MEAILRFAIVAVWLSMVAASASSQPQSREPNSLDPARGVVFSGNSAHILTDGLFSHGELGSLWDPTPTEISQLEVALSRELSDRLRSTRSRVRDYYRQYAGIHLKSQRLIFVNGFHRAHVEQTAEWLSQPHGESELTSFPAGARNETFWRQVPVQVADGGAFFFEAVYDPQTRRIVSLQFNGVG